MRSKTGRSHAGRNLSEKKEYLTLVEEHGPTIPSSVEPESALPFDTGISGTIGKAERLPNTEDKRGKTKPPYRSSKTKAADFFNQYFPGIFSAIIGVVFAIMGYFFVQISGQNREIGEAQTSIVDIKTQISSLQNDSKDLQKQENQLATWVALIRQKLGFYQPASNTSQPN